MLDQGILSSLIKYETLRANASNVVRPDGSNLDIVFDDSTGEEVLLCHLASMVPFHTGSFSPFPFGFEDTAIVSLAAHHLNVGDGSVVPEVAGLNDRCRIRFTVEMADTEFTAGDALKRVNTLTGRDPTGQEPLPCAFIGPYRSAASIPTSIILGTLGYPQLSPGSVASELDDKSQFPLFGRTLPSDSGNAIPLVLYLKNVLNLDHLALIYVNDPYGNGYAENLRKASAIYSPDLKIRQIPLDFQDGSFETAIRSLKETGFRYVLAAVLVSDTYDELLKEAYKQGVAGDGLHNWFFSVTFAGTLEGQTLEKGSPLHLAYRGSGLIQVSGGIEGFAIYDNYMAKLAELRNPDDLAYIKGKLPTYDHPSWDPDAVVGGSNYLKQFVNLYNPFVYEAVIAIGLSACAAIEEDDRLTGEHHTSVLRNTTFRSINGNSLVFDQSTGSRDPNSALYKVLNYVKKEVDGGIVFEPILSNIFQESKWIAVEPYIFSDGTSNLPIDIAPIQVDDESWVDLPVTILAASVLTVFLCFIYLVFREFRKKSDDSAWHVKKEDLQFEDPPIVLGQGSFGLVLLARYRGTNVAVKRVIPRQDTIKMTTRDLSESPWDNTEVSQGASIHADCIDIELEAPQVDTVTRIWNQKATNLSLAVGAIGPQKNECSSKGNSSVNGLYCLTPKNYKKMKQDFIEEMRVLSRLRHPCITTVMGAVVDRTDEPMLIMEHMEHGSLYDLLRNETMAIDGEIILPILRDISQGMRFLHSGDPTIIHGDLKARNILVDNRFRGKVADFGLSQKQQLGCVGTPYWMAPELLREEGLNTSASDVFSFGVILYEVFSRKDPYEGENMEDVLREIRDATICKRVVAPKGLPAQIKILMEDCLEEDPTQRPPFEEIDTRLKRISAEKATPSGECTKAPVSLFDIFPRHIAEALRDGRRVEPEERDLVTIFFSDIVSFTDIAASLEPQKVANLLSRLYHKFDSLSTDFDCYKVETIGDSFMCVTNLVKDQPDDHAECIAKFSIAAVKAANETLIDVDDPCKGTVDIRVGFHSGPVVADVVGQKNPRYCLFGDTVNTASRMESHSQKNRINCSKETARILQKQCPEIPLVCRGEIPVKGKGTMSCYWVNEKPKSSKERAIARVRKHQQARLKDREEKPGMASLDKSMSIVKQAFTEEIESDLDSSFDDLESNVWRRLQQKSGLRETQFVGDDFDNPTL